MIDGDSPSRPDLTFPCPNCGYNLTGLRENRCPECGGDFWIIAEPVDRFVLNTRRDVVAACVRLAVHVGIAWLAVFLLFGVAQRTHFEMAVHVVVIVVLVAGSANALCIHRYLDDRLMHFVRMWPQVRVIYRDWRTPPPRPLTFVERIHSSAPQRPLPRVLSVIMGLGIQLAHLVLSIHAAIMATAWY